MNVKRLLNLKMAIMKYVSVDIYLGIKEMIPQAIIAEKALNSKATPYIIGGGVLLTIGVGVFAYYQYRSIYCKMPWASCNDKKIRDVMKYKG